MTWRVFSGSRVTAVLCLLLLAINLIAGWAVVSAVREAEEAAHRDLQSRAAADAHSLMAVLAATRADLQFLSQSPALAELRAVLGDRDPMVRRWRRLDIESTLLLFLDSQPEVEELRILGPDGGGVIAAGRRGGAPVLTASEVEMQPGHRPHADDLIGSFPLPGSPPAGILEAVVHVDTLLAGALPAAGARLIRNPQLHNARQVLEAVVVPVHDPGWDPEVKWALAFPENRGFFDSLGKLGTRYRSTLAANLLLILLVGFFGIVSIRQARARALLEAEYRRQQEIGALERQVLHNERLAGIGRLAAGLAHEINNPLEGMSNYLALLESDLQAGRPEQCLQWARQVRQGLNRTAGITRQVLQFAEPGDAPPVVLDLRRVLEETVDFVRSNRQFRTARIELALPPAQLLVHGNAVTLSQVFLNLLLNAVEMQAGSGHTTITGSAQDGQVNVVVEDDGPGIPDETLSRIFEPFFSGRGSTGLGLFICEGIVRQHGGSIQAFNRPAGGAVFTVSLPMASTGIAGAEESRGASKAS